MNIYHLIIRPEVSIETAWEELESIGVNVLYSDEDPEGHQKILVCRLPNKEKITTHPSVLSVKPAPNLNIDWEMQWFQHGLNFHNGLVHVPIGDANIRLKPGPGFGDASHPTTRLVLKMMEHVVPCRPVLDVGCGSGILSLAALHWGARPIYAIDIDPEAICHTIENISLNDIKKSVWVGSAEELVQQDPPKKLVALMNMISSEQALAWESLSILQGHIHDCITSGILAEEQEAYLKLWNGRGWQLRGTLEEDGWMAFHWEK